jgi:hypothetical protein
MGNEPALFAKWSWKTPLPASSVLQVSRRR